MNGLGMDATLELDVEHFFEARQLEKRYAGVVRYEQLAPLLDGQSEKGVGDVQSTHLICRCFQIMPSPPIEDFSVSGLFDDVFEGAQKKYNAAAPKASMTIKLATTRAAAQGRGCARVLFRGFVPSS